MLRITKVADGPEFVTFKLEGRIVSDWVAVLEQECVNSLREKEKVVLNFSAVTFIDGSGVEMLKRIAANLQIVNCPPLIEDLIRAGEDE